MCGWYGGMLSQALDVPSLADILAPYADPSDAPVETADRDAEAARSWNVLFAVIGAEQDRRRGA